MHKRWPLPLMVLCALAIGSSPCLADSGFTSRLLRVQRSRATTTEPQVSAPGQDQVEKPVGTVRPRIALALGGGGSKACCEVGALRALKKAGINIDYVVGCSSGATIGGLYCAGVPIDQIDRKIVDGEIRKSMMPQIPRALLHLIAHVIHPRSMSGFTSGARFRKYLVKSFAGEPTIESLPTSFTAVATDLQTGKEVDIKSGLIASAILASASLPPLIRPHVLDGKILVDGGLVANLPARAARQTGADIVIGICCDTYVKVAEPKSFDSLRRTIGRVSDIYVLTTDHCAMPYADIIIHPDVDAVPLVTRDKSLLRYGIAQGERETERALPAIKKLIEQKTHTRVVQREGSQDQIR